MGGKQRRGLQRLQGLQGRERTGTDRHGLTRTDTDRHGQTRTGTDRHGRARTDAGENKQARTAAGEIRYYFGTDIGGNLEARLKPARTAHQIQGIPRPRPGARDGALKRAGFARLNVIPVSAGYCSPIGREAGPTERPPPFRGGECWVPSMRVDGVLMVPAGRGREIWGLLWAWRRRVWGIACKVWKGSPT